MSILKGNIPIAGLAHNTIVTGFNTFDCKWSDHLINDIQWLRADTFSWQDGSVYVTAYNKLVTEYATGTTETVGGITYKRTTNGFKIADASQESAILSKYNTDGIAWFYILDTTNTRFKLPRTKFGFEGLRTSVGDDIAESLPNIKGGFNSALNYYRNRSVDGVGAFSGVTGIVDGSASGSDCTAQVTMSFNASNSSSTYQDNAPVQERATQMYLYFYVGEFSQTAIEQTAGITSEQLNAKVDTSSLSQIYPVVQTYVNGTSWYRIYSDGWCEQGGVIEGSSASGSTTTITFLKTFANTNYYFNKMYQGTYTDVWRGEYGRIMSKTASTLTTWSGTTGEVYYWFASGYLAEGEW